MFVEGVPCRLEGLDINLNVRNMKLFFVFFFQHVFIRLKEHLVYARNNELASALQLTFL